MRQNRVTGSRSDHVANLGPASPLCRATSAARQVVLNQSRKSSRSATEAFNSRRPPPEKTQNACTGTARSRSSTKGVLGDAQGLETRPFWAIRVTPTAGACCRRAPTQPWCRGVRGQRRRRGPRARSLGRLVLDLGPVGQPVVAGIVPGVTAPGTRPTSGSPSRRPGRRAAALSVAMSEHLDGGDIHVSLAVTRLSNGRVLVWSESGFCRSHRCVGGRTGRCSTRSAACRPLPSAVVAAAKSRAAVLYVGLDRTVSRAVASSLAGASGATWRPAPTSATRWRVEGLVASLRHADHRDAGGQCRGYGAHPGVGDDGGDVRQHRLVGDVPAYRHVGGGVDRLRGQDSSEGQQHPDGHGAERVQEPGQHVGLPVQGGAEAEQDPRVPGFA